MRRASAFLNLGLAGIFAIMGIHWFGKGDAVLGAIGAAAAAVNVFVAVAKFRGGKREVS